MAVIIFGYGNHPEADIWYHASGCESLDNGYVAAIEVANPGFYERFTPEFVILTSA